MMALSARWQAPCDQGQAFREGGTGQKKDTLLTQQVGHTAGCIRGGCGCDPALHAACRNLIVYGMVVRIHFGE